MRARTASVNMLTEGMATAMEDGNISTGCIENGPNSTGCSNFSSTQAFSTTQFVTQASSRSLEPFEITDAENLLKEANARQFEMLIPSLVLVCIVLALGIPGNIITFYIYLTKMRKTASRVFILALAVCDLFNCAFTMTVEIAIICSYWDFDHPILCKVSRTMTYALNGTSALLLIGIAVDRYRKICSPLKPLFTPRRTRLICFVAGAIGCASSIPGFSIYGTRSFQFPLPSVNAYFVAKTCMIDDNYVKTLFPLMFFGVWMVMNIIVMVVLAVLYSLIGKAVFVRLRLEKARKNSVSQQARKKFLDLPSETSCSYDDILEEHSGSKRPPKVLNNISDPVKQTLNNALKNGLGKKATFNVFKKSKDRGMQRIRAGRTTIMLFSVTVAYIFSFVPFQVIVTIRAVARDLYPSLSPEEQSVFNFFLRSYVVNCAINPVLYGFFNKDFRIKIGQLLRGCFGCTPTQSSHTPGGRQLSSNSNRRDEDS